MEALPAHLNISKELFYVLLCIRLQTQLENRHNTRYYCEHES